MHNECHLGWPARSQPPGIILIRHGSFPHGRTASHYDGQNPEKDAEHHFNGEKKQKILQ